MKTLSKQAQNWIFIMSILGSYAWLGALGYIVWSFESQVSAKSAIYETDIPDEGIAPNAKIKPPFIFNVVPMSKVLISVNEEEYATLLEIFEYADFTFPDRVLPTMKTPISWEEHQKRYGKVYLLTYYEDNKGFLKEGRKVVRLTNEKECEGLQYKIISYKEFLKETKITPVQILLIKEYFKK